MASNDKSQPPYHYIAFIDEAGDPGLSKVQPVDPNGASEWMTMGAVLMRALDEKDAPGWVRNIRDLVRERQGAALHFRNMSDAKKLLAARHLSGLRLGGFVVASHKPNMKCWRNPAAEAYPSPRGWFYNWCIRLLLERVTDAVERHSHQVYGGPRYVKLVFSQRGGTKYNWLGAYLEVLINQAKAETTYLEKRVIKHKIITPLLFDVVAHHRSAGCQLADVVTSAFHCAADARGARWNTAAAEILRPIMPKEDGFHFDYSVALQPTPAWRAAKALTPDQKKIFKIYGYDL